MLTKWPTYCWENQSITAIPESELTSVSGPLSAPGQEKVTNSWHRLWTTKQHTEGGRRERERRQFYYNELRHRITALFLRSHKADPITKSASKKKVLEWAAIQPAVLYVTWQTAERCSEKPEREAANEWVCVWIIISQPLSDFDMPPACGHTDDFKTDSACTCTPTHTRPHKTPRVIHSAAISSLQSVGLIASSPPPPAELGSDPHSRSVTRWPTWHRVSSAGICIWTLAQLWREKQKRGDLWQITSWLLLWLPLHVPNCVFPLCRCLQSFLYFLFLVSHNASAWFISSSWFVLVCFCACPPP